MLARLFGSPSSALSTTSSGDVDPWLLVPRSGGVAVLLSCVGGHWPLGGSYLLAGATDWPLACSTVCASSPGGIGPQRPRPFGVPGFDSGGQFAALVSAVCPRQSRFPRGFGVLGPSGGECAEVSDPPFGFGAVSRAYVAAA
jgi:hypothetical protein